ncbi:MAG: Uma2 family endonuclease [Caldilineaceae bacterium]
MIIAPAEEKLISGEEFLAMGDIGPCQLVNGRIVPMSTTGGEHGLIEAELLRHLGNFNAQRKSGWVLGGEAGVYTRRNPDTVRGMDAAFISKERHPARPKGYLAVAPELLVEVVSPNDRWKEIQAKLKEYFAIGVDYVWLIEPEERTVFIYTELTEVIRLGAEDMLRGEGPLAGFEVPLAELFAE